MQIQVNSDNHVQGDVDLVAFAEGLVRDALDRFGSRVTRVEVHLSDENSRDKRSDDDKRCLVEARLAGLAPLSASHQGASVEQSLRGALDKLEKVVARTIERRDDPKGRTSFAGETS